MQVTASIFKAYDIRGTYLRTLDESLAEGLGRAFGTLALKEGLSALENLHFAAALNGQVWVPDAAQQALHQMGLRGREHLPLQVLSQGQKRRVALARLGLSPARLWLLDEPFVALDTAACGVLQALMQNHVARGGMVVFTSHQAVHLASGDNRSHRLGRA